MFRWMNRFECTGFVPLGVTSAAVLLSKQQSTFAKALLWHSFVLAEIEKLNKSSLTAFCVEGTNRTTGAKTLGKQLKGAGNKQSQLKAYKMILIAAVRAQLLTGSLSLKNKPTKK